MSNKAFAYYRTSSAANVGGDKDSLARQERRCGPMPPLMASRSSKRSMTRP